MATSLAGFRAYATARGNEAPADADDDLATEALTRATDHITYHYVRRFLADITVDEDDTDAATYEAAILELATPGFFSKTFTPDQQKVLTEVKGIKWTPIGDASGSEAATPVSTKIDAILRRYMFFPVGGFVV